MTIDKAIEILESVFDIPPSGASQDFKDAIRLGEEALKWLRQYRYARQPRKFFPLPGETKD